MASFAEKLRALMGDQISQSELSRRSGVSQRTISDYAAGVSAPSWKHVQSLARALKVSCKQLEDDDLELPEPVPTPKRGRPRIEPAPAPPPKKRGRPKKRSEGE